MNSKEQIFYLDGKADSMWNFSMNGELYRFLLENYGIEFANDGTEEVIIGEDTLNDIKNSNRGFSEAECTLIGFMMFNIEYVGGFVFKTVGEGE